MSGPEVLKIVEEALILAKMNHPNIIKYYDAFSENQFFYIITELCDVIKAFKN